MKLVNLVSSWLMIRPNTNSIKTILFIQSCWQAPSWVQRFRLSTNRIRIGLCLEICHIFSKLSRVFQIVESASNFLVLIIPKSLQFSHQIQQHLARHIELHTAIIFQIVGDFTTFLQQISIFTPAVVLRKPGKLRCRQRFGYKNRTAVKN